MKQKNTKGQDYTERLNKLSNAKWKQIFDVQKPYRWNLSRLNLGKTLDVGCGIGRNLKNLQHDSIGVDHNESAVIQAKESGLHAFTVDEFNKQKNIKKDYFDSMLLAHVLEHMSTKQGTDILKQYLPYVKNKIVIICPQEKGFTTDDTHVNFLKHSDIEKILLGIGLSIDQSYSFPFPRVIGKFFTYNETIVVAKKQ